MVSLYFSGFSITLLQVDQCVDLSQVLLLNGEIAVWQLKH